MKILVLEDSRKRIERFHREWPNADFVDTAADAIKLLKKNKYDLVTLDHDLGGKNMVDSRDKNCGMEVVRWLVDNPVEVDSIRVHSLNPIAAHRMAVALRKAGYDCTRWPYPAGLPKWPKGIRIG